MTEICSNSPKNLTVEQGFTSHRTLGKTANVCIIKMFNYFFGIMSDLVSHIITGPVLFSYILTYQLPFLTYPSIHFNSSNLLINVPSGCQPLCQPPTFSHTKTESFSWFIAAEPLSCYLCCASMTLGGLAVICSFLKENT